MPRVFKADEIPEGGRIRPLGKTLTEATNDAQARTQPEPRPAEPEAEPAPVEPHPPQVSADSLERVQRLLHEVVTSFGRQRNQLLQQLKPGLVKLAMAVARQIVGRELSADEDAVKRVMETALGELGRSGRVVARVSPEDAPVLREAIEQDQWAPPPMVELEIVADASVTRGGCVLESDYGQVDATIETQIAELARLLDNSENQHT